VMLSASPFPCDCRRASGHRWVSTNYACRIENAQRRPDIPGASGEKPSSSDRPAEETGGEVPQLPPQFGLAHWVCSFGERAGPQSPPLPLSPRLRHIVPRTGQCLIDATSLFPRRVVHRVASPPEHERRPSPHQGRRRGRRALRSRPAPDFGWAVKKPAFCGNPRRPKDQSTGTWGTRSVSRRGGLRWRRPQSPACGASRLASALSLSSHSLAFGGALRAPRVGVRGEL
jgi:hypothetical protein